MLYNFLDNSEKRTINLCNYNQHIHFVHPNRVINEHDLLYIRQGVWQISQDGMDYDLSEGDVILLQGGHHHYGLIPCESSVKTCFIHFGTHPKDCIKEKEDSADFWVFPMVSHCKNNPMVEHYFNRVISSYWSKGEYHEKKASSFLDLLLCEISNNKDSESHRYIVEDIKRFIQTNPNRFISNEEISKRYHYSTRTIASKFKESTGYSIHAWQMKTKCQMAEELMKYDPSLTLRELASTFGFCDEYHFGKCYKKIMGHSPKKSK